MITALAHKLPQPSDHIISVTAVGPERVDVTITLCSKSYELKTTRQDLQSNLFDIGWKFGDWFDSRVDADQVKLEDLVSNAKVARGDRKAKALCCNLVEFFAGIISEFLRQANQV